MHLRTTNIVERLTRKFQRRTKPVETVAGQASIYTTLAECFGREC
jgi:transposase-like protein